MIFTKNRSITFQFNRWHSLGFARYDDMMVAGNNINTFSDWKKVMTDLAEKAETEGRLKNAAMYYRGAEFYITQKDPDKIRFYNKFIDMFYQIYADNGIQRFKIPYDNTFLPALYVPANTHEKKGTILMHGGFDSFIEEFYAMMQIFSDNGYDVIAFEGPGQGGARRTYGLAWDEKWEKPTKAVLDFFNLDNVTIYGISMGGHLSLRAAAFEPRIKRVVTSGGALDYWKIPGPLSRGLLKLFLHFDNFTTKAMVKKMKRDEHHNWFAENSMYITKINNPFKASMKILDMNTENIQPKRITQDVLVLSGRNDHFIPIKMHNMMIKALRNAHSVTGIIYTKETQAHNHCQIGNIPLVCKDAIRWMDDKM
ncbi:MAG: alpha/beta hydrolase [Candidatus Thermoplasmatota archaeon]|nr:alpha/beta hydrolase [Candidatus Thermoplasmatota archaeon]MBU1940817.1 alpha/beta hydrolase [Candidatus Thermoplasmatota archaeon]